MSKYDSRKIKQANREIFDRQDYNYTKRRRIRFDDDTVIRLRKRYEQALGEKFKLCENFLDLGCGNGFIALNLARTGLMHHVSGIDISERMLQQCQKNAKILNINISLAQADAEFLPFRNDSFDLIVGHAILHHLPDVQDALRETYRILKPKGMCIFTEPSRLGSRIIAIFQWLFWFVPLLVRQYTKTELERMVEIDTFSAESLEHQAKEIGFSGVCTKPFAGFISRILYWILDPLSQKISFEFYHHQIQKLIDLFYILDERFFSKCIPKEWFDEVFIVMHK